MISLLQIIIALGIFNVWLLRYNKATEWRGGESASMEEEFAVYGLPPVAVKVIGFCKLSLAVLLILGLFLPAITQLAALGMSALMAGAVGMHLKVKDPLKKSLPAFIMLVLSVIVAFA